MTSHFEKSLLNALNSRTGVYTDGAETRILMPIHIEDIEEAKKIAATAGWAGRVIADYDHIETMVVEFTMIEQ